MALRLYPCLWFENQAQEAAVFYCSIFPNSRITRLNHHAVSFRLDGHRMLTINGREKASHFNDTVSMVISCDTQAQIDYYWRKLTADGGEEGFSGWCKDKYGVSWQIVPLVLGKLLADPEKAERVMALLLKMRKINVAPLLAC